MTNSRLLKPATDFPSLNSSKFYKNIYIIFSHAEIFKKKKKKKKEIPQRNLVVK